MPWEDSEAPGLLLRRSPSRTPKLRPCCMAIPRSSDSLSQVGPLNAIERARDFGAHGQLGVVRTGDRGGLRSCSLLTVSEPRGLRSYTT